MAKRLGKQDNLAQQGVAFVKLRAAEMGFVFTPTGDKTPSIDGHLQGWDETSDTNLYIAVQIKTGNSYARGLKTSSEFIHVSPLRREDILDWKHSNIPVILVWVSSDGSKRFALWGNAKLAKLASRTLKISKKSLFNQEARPKLLELARIGAGSPTIPRLTKPPLFPTRVSEVKKRAWKFYSEWREQGSNSPIFGKVDITLKGWRHITRVSSSQREVIHKLSLLPCARELIDTCTQSLFLRKIEDQVMDYTTELHSPSRLISLGKALELWARGKRKREFHALRGLYRSRFQADVMVEVILEVTKVNERVMTTKLYSIHEKRSWYE